MIFKDSYFEDEVRDGFFVPSEIKRAWAAELEVLSEIDKICKKHNIQYFADWGTLLAAVRHEGFIPWDDDLDIVMKREDYRRFMEIAQTELPEGFSAYNFRNHDNLWLFLGRVVGKRRICFEEEHLERFHQFPYIAGVDIFVLDYVSRDKEAEQKRDELALHTIAIADMIGEGKMHSDVREHELRKLEQICRIQIPRNLSAMEMRRELYGVVELIFGWFKEEEADELTQLFPFGLKPDGYRISKKCYEEALELPYENIRIHAPVQCCEMLERKYGDYMRLVRDAGGHDYPFFEAQKKQLQAVLDFPMPAYKYSSDQLKCEKDNNGYKQLLKEVLHSLEQTVSNLKQVRSISIKEVSDRKIYGNLSSSKNTQEKEQLIQKNLVQLENMQQTAIDMGTLIESVKGEGTQTVKCLEELCELIYECSVQLGQADDIAACITAMQNKIVETEQFLQTELLAQNEVVIFIDKAEHWHFVEWYWKKLIKTDNTDIFIVPLPYFYKKYDGTCYASKYEFEEIKKCIDSFIQRSRDKNVESCTKVVEYNEFDVKLHHPEQIIIQNPCDEWNQAITLLEDYYSRNLQKYTDQLVYIVPFRVEEFTKENYREYHNMQYYCTMPGVVRADVTYVQSGNMREVYIQKLIEFAGEDTRAVWEKKIVVAEGTEADNTSGKAKEKNKILSAGETCQQRQSEKACRKKIAFFVQVGLTIQYKEEMLKKLESVLEIFKGSQEKVELIWIGDKEHDVFLKNYDSEFAKKYDAISENFQKEGWGTYLDRTDASVSELVQMCDAYYGSASHIALEFEVKKKPVMIMDVEVL
mgnify:FL=1